jgi:hypothetical protein
VSLASSPGATPKLAIVESDSPSLYLKAVWNNLKYGWNSSKHVKFPVGDDVVLLGHRYVIPEDEPALRHDFTSRMWLTYRCDLPHALPDSNLR